MKKRLKSITKKTVIGIITLMMALTCTTNVNAAGTDDPVTLVNPVLQSYTKTSDKTWTMTQSTRFVLEASDDNRKSSSL